jgi:hypothetical protein
MNHRWLFQTTGFAAKVDLILAIYLPLAVLRLAPSGLRSMPSGNNDTGEKRKTFQQLSEI